MGPGAEAGDRRWGAAEEVFGVIRIECHALTVAPGH